MLLHLKRRVILSVLLLISSVVVFWLIAVGTIAGSARGRIFGAEHLDAVPRVRAAVVLGCVKTLPTGRGNLYYSRRIAAAAKLYHAGKVDCLIVSGDNHITSYDEPSDMKDSLVAAGVPEERIVCDYAGFRTLDSVVRARKVFGLDTFLIVSQPDHLRRAVFLARGFGCEAYGYAAEDVYGRYSLKTTLREQLAKMGALIDVIIRRNPKFLGRREHLPAPLNAAPPHK